MTICYVVHGFAGGDMFTTTGGLNRLWVNYSRIVLGDIGAFRLAPDGVSPQPPDGEPCVGGGPLDAYYGECITFLRRALEPQGYSIVPFGFDWRTPSPPDGVRLADAIRQSVSSGDPCAIVAHSTGVMIARLAWAELVRTHEEGLVRRIVSLGGPNYGTYQPVVLWSLAEPTLRQLWAANNSANILLGGHGVLVQARRWSLRELGQLFATFPTLYELLPQLDTPPAAFDPNRADLYLASAWPPECQISQAWLDHARYVVHPVLNSPAGKPPPWVMTSVAGIGQPTFDALEFPDMLGNIDALHATQFSDGVVPRDSAVLQGSESISVYCRHVDMPNALAITGDLARWVTDVRVPPDPPSPPITIQGVIQPMLQGPPLDIPVRGLHHC